MTHLNKPRLVTDRQTTAVFSTTTHTSAGSAAVCDTARVDVESWHSRRYWSERLGLSDAQLVRAVRAAGPAVVQIEQHLAERRARRARRARESAGA